MTLALDDVNIEVEEGQFIAVLGHNGSGKSTFAKHLNALLTPSKVLSGRWKRYVKRGEHSGYPQGSRYDLSKSG